MGVNLWLTISSSRMELLKEVRRVVNLGAGFSLWNINSSLQLQIVSCAFDQYAEGNSKMRGTRARAGVLRICSLLLED